MTVLAAPFAVRGRPWGRAAGWLLFLAPFFYLTYGGANWLAAQRTNVGSFVYGWEDQIPFVAWTVLPYWSINAFYGLSLFVCSTRAELDNHVRRLLTAQIVAVLFFVLLPLRFTFERPLLPGGVSGFLFAALETFDKPFNQAPSLHVAILIILWPFYQRHVPLWAKVPLHAWFALIGASVLTTYQHHFIDVPTGALLGFACLWLWPDNGESPLAGVRFTHDRKRRVLALRYAAAAVLCAGIGILVGGLGILLFWPALSLALVAANYAAIGAAGFQKARDGRMSLAARLLLAPYILGAFVNSRLWTRKDSAPAEVADGVWIGRIPTRREARAQPIATIVDVCAELPRMGLATWYRALPLLDLSTPDAEWLSTAADIIRRSRADGPVLVCCALGYSRSAAAIACWGVRAGPHANAEEAIAAIRKVRPRIVLDEATRAAIVAGAKP